MDKSETIKMIKYWGILLGHAVIMCIISMILGYLLSLVFVSNSSFWPKAIMAVIIVPLIYTFFLRRDTKELFFLAIMFVIISSFMTIPLLKYYNEELVANYKVDVKKADSLQIGIDIVSSSPIISLNSALCLNTNRDTGLNGSICVLTRFGNLINIIIVGILSIIGIFLSMLLGKYLSQLVVKK